MVGAEAPASIAILCGGLATRLGPLAADRPKSLVDVNGRPFLALQLELLAAAGVEDVVLCIGHLGDLIRDAIGDGRRHGVRVRYSDEGPTPLGTGGALRLAAPLLGETFLSLWGDSFLREDYRGALTRLRASAAEAQLLVWRDPAGLEPGNAAVRDGRVVRFQKGAPAPDLTHVDAGLLAFRRAALSPLPPGLPSSLEHDLLPRLAARGELLALETPRRYHEVGSPEGLSALRAALSQEAPR